MARKNRILWAILGSILKWTVTLSACFVGLWGLYAYKYRQITTAMEQAAAYPEPSETVEAAVATESDFRKSILVIGELVASHQITIQNELPGQVSEVNFRSGDHVQKGQVILRMDTAAEMADIEAAEATLAMAETKFGRLSRLVQQSAISQTELDEAAESLRIAKAKRKQLKTTIAKKTFVAPFSGRLGIFQLNVGQFLNVNSDIVTLLGDGDQMWVDFSVPQFYQGPQLGGTLSVAPISNENDSLAGSVKATIIAKDILVAKDSRSIKYRAAIQRIDFRPQQMFSVKVPIGDPQTLVTIPPNALRYDASGRYVYILQPNEKEETFRAFRRKVDVYFQNNDAVYLSAGLKPGEIVAATGAFKLREGILVYPKSPAGLTTNPSVSQESPDGTNTDSPIPTESKQ